MPTTFEEIHGVTPESARLSQEQARDYEVKEATKALHAFDLIDPDNYQEVRKVLGHLADQVSNNNL